MLARITARGVAIMFARGTQLKSGDASRLALRQWPLGRIVEKSHKFTPGGPCRNDLHQKLANIRGTKSVMATETGVGRPWLSRPLIPGARAQPRRLWEFVRTDHARAHARREGFLCADATRFCQRQKRRTSYPPAPELFREGPDCLGLAQHQPRVEAPSETVRDTWCS